MEIKETIKEFYNQQAEKFSQTRQKNWPEFNYILDEVKLLLSQKDKIIILELWCWDGRLSRFLLQNLPQDKFEYVWVDISSGLINIANKENTFSNVRFVVNDMLNFVENQQDQTFDFVVAVASFQHIPTRWERLLILKHIYRILTYEWELMMFNWSFSEWFFKKFKFQILKAFLVWILSLWGKPINDIMVPWKDKDNVFYRYYHIFFLFELKNLFKQAGFVIKNLCYIWKDWQPTVNRRYSRNSCIIGVKRVISNLG